MSLIDFILNVAGLLLWLNWRSVFADPFATPTPSTLSGTLRRAQPRQVQRWHFPAALAALLLVRAVIYQQIGPAVNWTPKLDFYFVVLTFRGTAFLPTLVFSLLSFLRAFVVLYFWLLTLAAINRHASGSDPFQKMISVQLGRAARWPWPVQVILPMLAAAGLWAAFHPVLVYFGIVSRTQSGLHLLVQSLLVGGGLVFSLKELLPVFLIVHLVASYVYLGRSPVWDFASLTSRNLLAPLNRVPLRLGRWDLAPLVGITLILLLLVTLPNLLLTYLDRHHLSLWPQ